MMSVAISIFAPNLVASYGHVTDLLDGNSVKEYNANIYNI